MPDIKEFKSLFDSPKKARITILCSLVVLLTLGAVVVYIIYTLTTPGADVPPSQTEAVSDAPAESDPPEETVAPTQEVVGIVPTLTIDEARALVLEHAGVAEGQANVSREALSQDNGIWVYEFRFRTEQTQYEYLINANTGEVRSIVKETFVYPSPDVTDPPVPSIPTVTESVPPVQTAAPRPSAAPQSSNPPQPAASAQPVQSSQPASTQLTVEAAKSAALADAGLSASAVTFTKAAQDYENGVLVYELEFYTSTHEYEYEINAATGGVHSRSVEAFQTAAPTPGPSQPASMYIGADRAKAIALEHAGLSASQVTFTHVQMEREHGTMVYEIEFRQGGTEYEYEIDAATGRILDHEREQDHH